MIKTERLDPVNFHLMNVLAESEIYSNLFRTVPNHGCNQFVGGIAQYYVAALRGTYKAQICLPQTVTKSPGTTGNATAAKSYTTINVLVIREKSQNF